jgi:quercetin dioxygenase-like cupin family protein
MAKRMSSASPRYVRFSCCYYLVVASFTLLVVVSLCLSQSSRSPFLLLLQVEAAASQEVPLSREQKDDNNNNDVDDDAGKKWWSHLHLLPVKRSFTSPLVNETFHVLQECDDTNGEYTLLKVVAPPNTTQVPMHHHDGYDEIIHVLEGVFHTTIDGVNRSYTAGQDLVFPQQVSHLWWTSPTAKGPTTILLKMEPCFDGFHETVEIYSNLPKEWIDVNNPGIIKDFWTSAILYHIGGTVIEGGPWYQRIILWVLFPIMANTNKGKRLQEELRQQYLYHRTTTTTTTNDDDDDEIHLESTTTTTTTTTMPSTAESTSTTQDVDAEL